MHVIDYLSSQGMVLMPPVHGVEEETLVNYSPRVTTIITPPTKIQRNATQHCIA